MKKRWKRWLKRAGIKAGGIAFRMAKGFLGKRDPLKAERVGRKLGRLAYRFAGKHRNRALLNLKLVFPDMREAERTALAIRCFEHFGMLAADFLRAEHRTMGEVEASIVEIEGWEHAQAALGQHKGVIGVTGHFGNWERFGAFVAQRGMPLHVVQRDADDPGLNEEMTRLRKLSGMVVLSRGNAARAMLSALREDKVIAVLADQNCTESFVPFFGLPTGTVLGPAVLHQRTGSPIMPGYCVRIGPNRFKIIIHPELKPKEGIDDPTLALTHAMNESLERVIRDYPEQWLWLHDRWKSARRRGLVPGP
jgi:KDO2-lipid IV(A) lauroyltransferase